MNWAPSPFGCSIRRPTAPWSSSPPPPAISAWWHKAPPCASERSSDVFPLPPNAAAPNQLSPLLPSPFFLRVGPNAYATHRRLMTCEKGPDELPTCSVAWQPPDATPHCCVVDSRPDPHHGNRYRPGDRPQRRRRAHGRGHGHLRRNQ